MNKQHLYSGAIGAIIIVITLIIICIACSWCDYALIYISDPSAKETNLGIVLTPAEYMNHIGGFYNTIITIIIALFALISYIYYRISKKEMQEQIHSDVATILQHLMRDSKEFEQSVLNALYGRLADEYPNNDTISEIVTKIENLNNRVQTIEDKSNSAHHAEDHSPNNVIF